MLWYSEDLKEPSNDYTLKYKGFLGISPPYLCNCITPKKTVYTPETYICFLTAELRKQTLVVAAAACDWNKLQDRKLQNQVSSYALKPSFILCVFDYSIGVVCFSFPFSPGRKRLKVDDKKQKY